MPYQQITTDGWIENISLISAENKEAAVICVLLLSRQNKKMRRWELAIWATTSGVSGSERCYVGGLGWAAEDGRLSTTIHHADSLSFSWPI